MKAVLFACLLLLQATPRPPAMKSAMKCAPTAALPDAGELARATEVVSGFNGLALDARPRDRAYRFVVGGHLYGAPQNKSSIYPAPSLLANLERINASGASFFVSLGDVIRFTTPAHIAAYRRSFVERLEMPLFNAAGNHDVDGRAGFLAAFPQPTTMHFVHGRVLHLILDTELDVGRISGAQLLFLCAALARAAALDEVRSVAVHAHKLVWTDGRADLRLVHEHVNHPNGYVNDGGFVRDVLPALRALARTKPVVWFSGDVGVPGRLPLFHHREPDVDLTWVAVGLGDTKDDALLLVDVTPAGRMSFTVMRMDGQSSRPLEEFGLEHWRKHFSP